MSPKPLLHCAIYTRKSSDEGLEQAFNSLDAQYEACTAYVASQRHEGWQLVPDRFDDGGLSGATLDRPALQRLFTEIDAGRIGMVVVYKIDRLTRSLADFTRLLERLDARGASFVSVTQAFNTASSMGRLTLNVLLSFAQFEREVTAERIRDKIAASKKRGFWMGGTVPLGYDPDPDPAVRGLVVNEAEATTVERLFTLYDELGSLSQVREAAEQLGIRSKLRTPPSGRTRGGAALTNGMIHHLLTNPVYIGRIRHKKLDYPGQHRAIIEDGLWARVQAKLVAASRRKRHGPEAQRSAGPPSGALLTGKLRDETGDRLTPSHTLRHGRRYLYYVSNRLIAGGPDPAGWRLAARGLEAAVRSLVLAHLRSAKDRHMLTRTPDARLAARLATLCDHLIARIEREPDAIGVLIAEGRLGRGAISLDLALEPLAAALELTPEDLSPALLSLAAPAALRRRGVETRLVVGVEREVTDPTLRQSLAEACAWAAALKAGASLTHLATKARASDSHLRRRLPLAFLSPRLQAAILDGRLPAGVTLEHLLAAALTPDWEEQERQVSHAGLSLTRPEFLSGA